MKKYTCIYCNTVFLAHNKCIAHQRFCKLNPDYQKNLEQIKSASKLGIKKYSIICCNSQKITKTFTCKFCNERFNREYTELQLKQKKKFPEFCSIKCSRTYSSRFRNNKNISDILKKKNNSIHKHICPICKCEFESTSISNRKICPNCRTKTCKICNKKFIPKNNSDRETCSDKCYHELLSRHVQENIKNGTHKGWISRKIISYPEKFFMNVLNNNNIQFQHNYVVKKIDLGIKCNSCYFLDFFIGKNLDLEIDGEQHKYRTENDSERDKKLTEHGYIVYRIPWNEINTESGKKSMKEKIDKFLEFYKQII